MENEGDQDMPCGGTKKLKSPVWRSGAAMKVGDKAQCNVCNLLFSCQDGNTSNIVCHVKKRHPGSEECKAMLKMFSEAAEARKAKRLKESLKPKQATLFNFVNVKKPITKHEKNKINNAIEEYIIGTNSPLSTTEDPLFRKLLFTLHSG